MNLNSIYNNRPYLFDISKKDQDGCDLAKELFKLCGMPNIENIQPLCSNLEYDAYTGDQDGARYCLKYSMDESSSYLQQESHIINQTFPYSPRLFFSGAVKFGEPVYCLVSSYEFAYSIKDFGLSIISSEFDSFLFTFKQISLAKTYKTFSQYLADLFENKNIKNLPQQTINSISAHSDFEKLQEITGGIEKEILYLARPSLVKHSECCHGSLQPSNVLVNGGLFKFIDFGNCYIGNRLLDLCRLFIFMGLSNDSQKKLLQQYCKFENRNYDASLIEQFHACYQLASRIVFYELLFNYCAETYLFSSARPQKILELIELFAKNNQTFLTFPAVYRHKDFIVKDLMEPIIGSYGTGPNPA